MIVNQDAKLKNEVVTFTSSETGNNKLPDILIQVVMFCTLKQILWMCLLAKPNNTLLN